VISYSNAVKQQALGVREETLRVHGAVSAECALEMARGVRRTLDVQVGLSATGIAGPDGGQRPSRSAWSISASARRWAKPPRNTAGRTTAAATNGPPPTPRSRCCCNISARTRSGKTLLKQIRNPGLTSLKRCYMLQLFA
jgi:hypothetical protein